MSYIISHNFKTFHLPYFVKVVDKESFTEIYNPEFATIFSTKKEAQDWINYSSPMKKYSKVVDYKKSVKEYQEWYKSGTPRRTLGCINRSMSRPYNNDSLDVVIDWWIYYSSNDDLIDYEDFGTWPKLYSLTKHIHDVSGYHSKDYKELYITFDLYTSRDGNFEEFEAELNRIIHKVTYKDEEGYLIFPIFDHYLSEGGNSVSLLFHPDIKKVKIGGRWHKGEYSSLADAFEYLRKERYYE